MSGTFRGANFKLTKQEIAGMESRGCWLGFLQGMPYIKKASKKFLKLGVDRLTIHFPKEKLVGWSDHSFKMFKWTKNAPKDTTKVRWEFFPYSLVRRGDKKA